MSDVDANLLSAQGERVRVSVATAADIGPYRDAMNRSAERIGRWNPVNAHDLVHHLAAQSEKHRTFLVRATTDERVDADGLVVCINVSNVIQGRFMSATLGYNAFDPYVGTGLFKEGLALTVGIALRQAPAGMGLHRVEANVRTGNADSAGLLRSLGFRRERTIRRMLWLAEGLGGASAWRDHDSFAVTREEWPAPSFASNVGLRGVVVAGRDVNVPVMVAAGRELGAAVLFDLPFEAALEVAHRSGAPVLWHAGERADDAVAALNQRGANATRVDDAFLGRSLSPRDVVALALRLRPSFD